MTYRKYLFQVPLLFLVGMEYLQKCLVHLRLALEAVLDLVDIVDGMIELHWLRRLLRLSWGKGRGGQGFLGRRGPTGRWLVVAVVSRIAGRH